MQGQPQRIISQRLQRFSWYSHDFASSGVANVILTFVFPAYFAKQIAPNAIVGTQLWGYTFAIVGFILAILSPTLGAIADYNGRRKTWLFISTYLVIFAVSGLWFSYPTPQAILRTLIFI